MRLRGRGLILGLVLILSDCLQIQHLLIPPLSQSAVQLQPPALGDSRLPVRGSISVCLAVLSCLSSSYTGYSYVCMPVCDPLFCCMHMVVYMSTFAPACLAVGAQLYDIQEWKPVCVMVYSVLQCQGRLLTQHCDLWHTACWAVIVLLVTFHWVRSSQSIHQCPERLVAYF